MSVINTNITSMIGQQNLRESQNSLQTSMERLSSGLRINSAKDDAAGQAIANRFTSQITGLNQASRNANDGISIAQTAEGALNQVNDNVQRIRELTVQAENGTNSQSDLGSIQDEITQRLEEIDRISRETDFNGTAVLADGVEAMNIQVGANDGQTIEIAFEAINSTELGINDFSVRSTELVDGADDDAFYGDQVTADANSIVASGSVASGSSGDISISLNGQSFDFTFISGASADTASGSNEIGSNGGVGLSSLVSPEASSTLPDGSTALDADNLVTAEDGTVFYDDQNGNLYNVEFSQTASDGSDSAGLTFNLVDGTDAEPLDSSSGFTVDPNEESAATASPLGVLDNALSQIDGLRSELGAVQNRFEDAITNLDTNATNLSDARSRIEDADYAMEVAEMTRAQILQQAGTSVLAQANQLPQNVLSLLG